MTEISRRFFHGMLISALGTGALFSQRFALAQSGDLAAGAYVYKLQYFRKKRQILFAVYALNKSNVSEVVPITLILSLDRAATDIVHTIQCSADPVISNITRQKYTMKKGGIAPKTPLYCTLFLGAEKMPSRAIKLAA